MEPYNLYNPSGFWGHAHFWNPVKIHPPRECPPGLGSGADSVIQNFVFKIPPNPHLQILINLLFFKYLLFYICYLIIFWYNTPRKAKGFLKSTEEEVSTRWSLVSGLWYLASDHWQNSGKTGEKAAIFGQKTEKTEQRVDKKGKGMDKLGVRNNTYKTRQKQRFQPKNKENPFPRNIFNPKKPKPSKTGQTKKYPQGPVKTGNIFQKILLTP